MSNKRNTLLWVLYDFANSIVIITFFFYLSQWLVIEGGLSSFWFNSIFVGGTLLLVATAPITAAISDKIQNRKKFLVITTLGSVLFFGATAIVANLGSQYIAWVAVLYLFAQYFYQFSFVFYNPMIEQLASLEKRGRVSGLGQAANWLGQIVGILISLIFVGGGRTAPLLPATIIFFLLALPMLIFFKENRPIGLQNKVTLQLTKEETRRSLSKIYSFMKYSPAAGFLVAFFFFNDAFVTLSNNFPILVERLFQVTDTAKSIVLITILLTSAIGAYVSGRLADRIGMKKTLKLVLGAWIVVIPIVSLITSFTIFAVTGAIVGLLYGSVWSVTRAYLSGILPTGEVNYGFSIYTLMERVATFAGPLTWGLIVGYYGEESAFGYRAAGLFMTIFVIVGYILIRKIPEYKVR